MSVRNPFHAHALLSGAFVCFRKGIASFLIIAVMASVILLVPSYGIQSIGPRTFAKVYQELGTDAETFASMQQSLNTRDYEAAGRIAQTMEIARGAGDPEQAFAVVNRILVRMTRTVYMEFFLWLILIALIQIIAFAYYVRITLQPERSIVDHQKALQMITLCFWIVIRSFVWIPLLGIIIAFFLLPRFILSPYLLLEERKDVMQSVRESIIRTKKSWHRMISPLYFYVLLCLLAGMVVSEMIHVRLSDNVYSVSVLVQWFIMQTSIFLSAGVIVTVGRIVREGYHNEGKYVHAEEASEM
jgi:hypothetical protein